MKVKLLSVADSSSAIVNRSQNLILNKVNEFFSDVGGFLPCAGKKELLTNLNEAFDENDVVIVCADVSVYILIKQLLMKALGIEGHSDERIEQRLLENPESGANMTLEAHALVPDGAEALISKDGLYSGFAIKSGEQHLIYLPFDLSRISSILEDGLNSYFIRLTGREMPGEVEFTLLRDMVKKLEDDSATVGFAQTQTSVFVSECVNTYRFLGEYIRFTECEEDDQNKLSLKDLAAKMSDEARIKSGADLGAVISKVYSSRDSEDTKMFLYVSVSDSREARVKKLFSQEGETPVELVAAATQTVFEMIKEYGSGYDERIEPNELDVSDHSALSDVYEPDEQDEEFEKEDGKIPVAVKILLIVAIVLFLGVVGYIGAHLLGIGASATNESLTNVTEYAGQAEVREYQTNNQTKAAAVKTEDTALPDETKESTSADTTVDETSAYPSLTAERMSSTAGTSAKVAEIYTKAKSKTVTTAENVKTASSTAADTTTKAATTTKTAETAAKTVKTAPAPVQVKATTTLKADNPSLSDTVFTFTAYGYGHGAGMSQEGANAFARQGKDYKYILDYYFPGTQLKKDTDPVKTVTHSDVTYSLKDYLCSAAGAEAGPSAPLEAIKAQMVAIYTLVLYRGGDVSGANECNGDFAYGKYASLDKACDAVIGEYLTCNGKPIDALFSSSCSGCTASSYSAWGSSSPAYLKGGTKSPETVKVSTYTISAEDFKKAFLLKYPTADFSGKPESWIEIIERDPAKNDYGVSYVAKIKVGGVILKGNEFRSVLGTANLKSHCFTYVVK